MTNLERPEVEPMMEPAPKELTLKDIVVGELLGFEDVVPDSRRKILPCDNQDNVHYMSSHTCGTYNGGSVSSWLGGIKSTQSSSRTTNRV